ncbi:MAG: DNA damage-inducible protein 1 [Bathelium mastoideum]|nr:MAG: DNA damage-inducible protein 1 [Bathelium mastoideum]
MYRRSLAPEVSHVPRVTISINAPENELDGELVTLDLPAELTVAGLKSSVQAETSLPAHAQQFYLNGQPLSGDDKTLDDIGIKNGEMLAVLINKDPARSPAGATQNQRTLHQGGQSQQMNGAGGRRLPTAGEVETIRMRLLNDPEGQGRVREHNPDLISALYDQNRFREMYFRVVRQEEDRAREREEQVRLLNEDPFNVEAQRKIEEMIRRDNVVENLQHAIENNPEVFGRVTMLYINAEVNGHPVKAFVDSGAQATIMSPSCAETCNIMRLIDTRYAGVARGVGTAKILGRVHSADIKIGDAELPCAFTVMEGKDVDLLLGLDMLKRYQACIDLQKGVLRFQGNEVPFLPESEIPKYMETEIDEPTIAGPNGTEIGAKSGAVRPAGATASTASSTIAIGGSSGKSPTNFRGQGQTLGSGSSSGTTAPRSALASFPQESINQLQSLGFSREEAIRALEATDGNVEYAAGLLLG